MKKLIVALFLLSSSYGQADMIKPAGLDIICKSKTKGAPTIQITSSKYGSEVTIGRSTIAGEQLIAGTEGSGPYLQAVSNVGNYNITVLGGALEEAFYESSTITEGTAEAYVNLFGEGLQFEATCVGTFAF